MRFSNDGFQPLTHQTSKEMANPNDVTIDIPLTKVTTTGSATGARKAGTSSPSHSQYHADFPDPMNEKAARPSSRRNGTAGPRAVEANRRYA